MATNITTRAALSENPINSEKTKSMSKDSNQSNCCVCDKPIAEQTRTMKCQDALYCDGSCQSWMHRACIGLSLKAFEAYNVSSKPYICPHCTIDSQNKEIVCLRNEIASLHTTISDINRSLSQSQHNTIVPESTVSSDLSTKTYASVTQQNTPQQNVIIPKVSTCMIESSMWWYVV